MALRDMVRTEPNERVDRGDFDQGQRGSRAEARAITKGLLGGSNLRVLSGFAVTASGTPDAFVTVAAGKALLAYTHPGTGEVEYGVVVCDELPASIQLDFTGKANATYGIWVRFAAPAGQTGTRVFWDATLGAEVAGVISTRFVAAWEAQIAALSPGTDWMKVADAVWGGATVATGNITKVRNLFFEGLEPAYAAQWGDGVNDRNVDRASYGASNLLTWVQAVRRQLTDMIGAGGAGWAAAIPTSLQAAATHIALATNPHGTTLVQTTLQLTKLIQAAGNAALKLSASNGTDGQVAVVTLHAATLARDLTPDVAVWSGVPVIKFDIFPALSAKAAAYIESFVGGVIQGVTLTPLPLLGAVADVGVGTPQGRLLDVVISGHGYRAPAGADRDVQIEVRVLEFTTGHPSAGARTVLATTTIDTLTLTGDWTVTLAVNADIDTSTKNYAIEIYWFQEASVGAAIGIYTIQAVYRRNRLF